LADGFFAAHGRKITFLFGEGKKLVGIWKKVWIHGNSSFLESAAEKERKTARKLRIVLEIAEIRSSRVTLHA
jgi:hypothetical protein